MKRILPAALAALIASPALAHLPPGEYGSVAAGLSHPLFGADHILAMVAVGLWAALLGGRALWALPGSFVAAMALGFGLAVAGMPLPLVEPMILASVILLGLAVALALKLDLAICAALVALFGLFHGHAHGGELGEAAALRFGLGFVIATAALHGAGLMLGLSATRLGRMAPRVLGAATVLGGAVLAFG